MIILMLGPLGSGKGTQTKRLVDRFKLHHLSMGDLLREAAKKRRDIDELINEKGKLVPAKVTFSILKEYLDEKGLDDNLILDGFPRMIEQYELLKGWLREKNKKLDLVIVLKIGEKESVRRLSARRMHAKTRKIYNLVTSPKPGPEISLEDLIQREDDKPEAIRSRLKWYKSDVVPLIEVLKKESNVVEVDGERSIDEIQKELVEIVKKIAKK